MVSRVVALPSSLPVPEALEPAADLIVQWEGADRNATRNFDRLHACTPAALSPLAEDLLDLASAVYLTDIGLPRGRNEQWVRRISLQVPVREPSFWTEQSAALTHLLYVLTRDHVQLEFVPGAPEMNSAAQAEHSSRAVDCVSLLSGGIDSLAGAVMLLKTERQPLFVAHSSGNPSVRAAQSAVVEGLQKLAPDAVRLVEAGLQGGNGSRSRHPYPPPQQREPSQRSRSLLFLSLAIAAAEKTGASEAYVFENGILTMALPLSEARVGGMSTRSTHPKVLALLNELCRKAGFGCQLTNPFVYQTKAEIVRDVLRPVLSPFEVQRAVSCWATGRSSRQCGGCTACLVRRFAMRAAGLPDEAYQIDVFHRPADYFGTEGYTNLMDLLGQCLRVRAASDVDLLYAYPELLDLPAAGVSIPETMAMYRRHAEQVLGVVESELPELARLL